MKQGVCLLAVVLALVCSLTGCSFLQSTPQDASSRASSEAPKIVTGDSKRRGADLKPVNGVGELVEPDEDTPSSAESNAPLDSPLMWDLSLLPYRAMLTGDEQKVYDEIYANIAAFNNHFSLVNPAYANRIDSIVHAVYYDNPELFWVDASYRYGYTSDNRVTDVTVTFNSLAASPEDSKAQFDQAADELIALAQGFSTDVEKEKAVHDALVSKVDYQLSSAQNQSAYSALVTQRSVCAGYSRAFQYVMMKLGIPCYYCVGFAGENHAWNIIKLGDDYYNVDLSWDDPIGSEPGEIHYEYFNITDAQIAYDHQRQDLSINLPPCNGTEMSYNNVFGGDEPVREGGAPQHFQDLGFTPQDVVQSVEDYYERSRQAVVEAGSGESTVSMVLQSEMVRQQIFAAISNRGWSQGFMAPAAQELNIQDYSAKIAVKYEELADGYILLTQIVTFTTGASEDAA